MRVTVRNPVPHTVHYTPSEPGSATDYYRVAGPAQAVGGEVRHCLRVATGRGDCAAARDIALSDTAAIEALGAHDDIVIVGAGALNIFRMFGSSLSGVAPSLIAGLVAAGYPCWLDVDDNYLECPVLDVIYRATLQRDGLAAADAERPRMERIHREMQSQAHARLARFHSAFTGVVAATQALADCICTQHALRNVRVHPNAITRRDSSEPLPRLDRAVLRVGLAGHQLKATADLQSVLPTLIFAARRHTQIELHLFGLHADPERRLERSPATVPLADGVTYCYHPFQLDYGVFQHAIGILDIALGPLADTVYNRCRSASKWFEHSAHETPMLLPDLPPFDCVEDGVTGLKYRDPAELPALLERLIGDPHLRQRIGAAARTAVLREHTLEERTPLWRALAAEHGAVPRRASYPSCSTGMPPPWT